MKSRRLKLTCWYWLQRHTRTLRWLLALIWPLPQLPGKLALELELRRCERNWRKP